MNRPELLVGFRESIKKWKEKFIFVKVSELGELAKGMRWREPVKMTDHIPSTWEYDAGSMGRNGSLVLNVRNLQEPVLYAASLSPMPVEKARELTDRGKCRWWYKST